MADELSVGGGALGGGTFGMALGMCLGVTAGGVIFIIREGVIGAEVGKMILGTG